MQRIRVEGCVGRVKAVFAAAGVATMLLQAGSAWAEKKQRPPVPEPGPRPTLRIPVAPLGYLPPGAYYETYRITWASLGFFDDDHLLFSFHRLGLLKPLPNDPDRDDNQEIRAVVLDARTGKVLRQTEWRMRDKDRYQWPFVDGKFLIRIGETLYEVGQSLKLEPFLQFPSEPMVELSPGRKWMAVEYQDPTLKKAGPSLESSTGMRSEYRLAIVPAGTRQVVAEGRLDEAAELPLMGDGWLGVKQAKTLGYWAINAMPFHGSPQFVGSVKSYCRPKLQPLSETVALVSWCTQADDEQPVFAVNLAGKELWQDKWEQKYVWPYFDFAENGSRFAYESVAINAPMSVVAGSLDQDDIAGQMVGVYDTESGKMVLVKDVSPVLTAGQNVALSPDGRRFAVLRHGAIEIYDLPPVPKAAGPAPAPETALKGKKGATSKQ